jgi:hypothetical protein
MRLGRATVPLDLLSWRFRELKRRVRSAFAE